jgi:hypothetical protein
VIVVVGQRPPSKRYAEADGASVSASRRAASVAFTGLVFGM